MSNNGDDKVQGFSPEIPGNNGKRKILNPSEFSDAFSVPRSSNVIDHLVIPGDKARDILMRTNFDKPTHGTVVAVAFAAELNAVRKYHYPLGEGALLDNAAARVSDKGLAREQVVRSITYDNSSGRSKQGMKEMIKGLFGGEKESPKE